MRVWVHLWEACVLSWQPHTFLRVLEGRHLVSFVVCRVYMYKEGSSRLKIEVLYISTPIEKSLGQISRWFLAYPLTRIFRSMKENWDFIPRYCIQLWIHIYFRPVEIWDLIIHSWVHPLSNFYAPGSNDRGAYCFCSVCLSVCLSVCMYVCLFVCLLSTLTFAITFER